MDKFPGGFVIPSVADLKKLYAAENLDVSHLINGEQFTDYGEQVIAYFEFRANVLTNHVEKMLMDMERAQAAYVKLSEARDYNCPLPRNNQGKAKGAPRYLNCLINMIAEETLGVKDIDFDPMEMTSFTHDRMPIRSLTRRVDGAIPGVINPRIIWEIKEYYYTTTFGSKISDGIYATQLDGHELNEVERTFGIHVQHIMFVDGHHTWWHSGRSYLCRLLDVLHQGLVDRVIFGAEVLTEWKPLLQEVKNQNGGSQFR